MTTLKKPAARLGDRWSDFLDQPCLVRPVEWRKTDNGRGGEDMILFAEVLVARPDKGSGQYFNLGQVPIWWKGVTQQVEDADVADGEWIGGRLHQGTDSNPKAYTLLDPTGEDLEALEAILASLGTF